MKKHIIYLTILAFFVHGMTFSQSVLYPVPELSLNYEVGLGYDPSYPGEANHNKCVEFDIDEKKYRKVEFEISEIEDLKSLFSKMQFSAALEAKSGFNSVSGSFSSLSAASFKSNNLVVLIKVTVYTGNKTLTNIKLTEGIDPDLSEADIARKFGRELINTETKGATGYVLFQLSNISATEKNMIKASMEGNYAEAVKAESNFSKSIKRNHKTAKLKVIVDNIGGSDNNELGLVIKNPSDINLLKEAMAKFVEGATFENSVGLIYSTINIGQFFNIGRIGIMDPISEGDLLRIYEQYLNIKKIIKEIEFFTTPFDEDKRYLEQFVTEEKKIELRESRAQYENAAKILKEAGMACLRSNGCDLPDYGNLPTLNLPKIPLLPQVITFDARKELAKNRGSKKPGATIGYYQYIVAISNNDPSVNLREARIETPTGLTLYKKSVSPTFKEKIVRRSAERFDVMGFPALTDKELLNGFVYFQIPIKKGSTNEETFVLEDTFGRKVYYNLFESFR